MPMIKVREVRAKSGHRLDLWFSDGTRGVADVRALLARRALSALRDEALFKKVYVEHGAVAWPGDIGVATEALYALVHDLQHPTSIEDALANEREVSLREFRRLAGVTQVEAAEALAIDQGQLSRFERQDDRLVSSLRKYVEALGGQLEVVAVLGNKRITLTGV